MQRMMMKRRLCILQLKKVTSKLPTSFANTGQYRESTNTSMEFAAYSVNVDKLTYVEHHRTKILQCTALGQASLNLSD